MKFVIVTEDEDGTMKAYGPLEENETDMVLGLAYRKDEVEGAHIVGVYPPSILTR